MRFDREFRFLTAKKLIGFCVTIPLAIILDSYWALVIGQTVSRIGGTALSYWVHPYRPRFSLEARHELFNFSKWLLIINGIGFLKERSSDWVIGRVAGPAALGAFNMSYELASMPSSELVAPINRAVFPAYAKLATEGPGALRPEYLSVISMIVLLAVPAVLGLAATAPVLIPVMLGPNWSAAIPVLTLMAFFGFTNIVQSNAQAAYLALGRADIPAKLNGLHVVVQTAALIPLTMKYGVVGAAAAYVVTAAIMIPLSLGVVLRMLHIHVFTFIGQIWRPVLAATVMYALVREFLVLTAGYEGALAAQLRLLLAVVIGITAYLSLVLVFWLMKGKPPGAEKIVLARLGSMAGRFLSRRGAVSI
jgi:lipopolysaccharide exporter